MFPHTDGDLLETANLLAPDALEAQSDKKHVEQKKTPETAAAAPAKILFLDGVRGLAALLVVTQHSHEYMQDLNLGACAVDAFFVLSSFLLTMLFMRKSEKLLAQGASYRKWGFTLADYFSKRFFRIYPLFALVAAVPTVRYYVLWTLPLEHITYYFFIPVFVLTVLRLKKLWWAPFIPAYCWVVYEGWFTFRWSQMGLSEHFPTFLSGSMAAAIFVKLDTWIKASGFTFNVYQVGAIRVIEFSAVSILLSLSFQGLFFHWIFFHWIHGSIAPTTPGLPFISVLLTVVLVVEMLLPSGLSSLLEWSGLRYCGKVSFSIYLLHGFVMYADAVGTQPNYYDRFFASYGLTILLATVSYHLVEYPSQLLAQHVSQYLARREANGSSGAIPSIGCKLRVGDTVLPTRRE
ncbi:hypothetical protein PHYSODRAFT_253840 [Phytophthora sojae]|uniref:Acyltransferase 3 domain-containing protein n=1 Tax=Phytophthora sojae (strain P6497) TaxID=1094619 RepID=G4YSF0_PHYSP|nr:hypothetical protein PHYSODRAFT_253840 [Phytophthora sojae]EGZ22966.1 hypothetical protein PHYSODRAFT_253840 [Phytophthora sojae]|eukprot:XP_009518254.1 hypothetical protein PHYSODRAFT_253840 [Phytophthora sojae]